MGGALHGLTVPLLFFSLSNRTEKMEPIVFILILFIAINTLLKISYWKVWQAALFGLVCAGFVLGVYPFAIAQSKTQLSGYLADSKIMQDIAVLVTFESVLYLAFCFSALRGLYGRRAKRWIKPLYGYPGLLIFPALFYLLVTTVFSLPGADFAGIAYGIAGAVCVFVPLLSAGIRYLLPEKELRLEVQFLVSLFVALTGLICTVNGNVTYAAVEEPLDTPALLFAAAGFLFFFVIGYCWNKYKWKFKRK